MKRISLMLIVLLLAPVAMAEDANGLISKKSPYSVSETLDRLQGILEKKGITVAVRWNHSERAREVEIPMRDTEVLIFGNPKLGSHLMTSKQTSGIDLPLKALAWEDAEGQVWLTYNDPQYLADRHGITDRPEIIRKMTGALGKMTDAAVAK